MNHKDFIELLISIKKEAKSDLEAAQDGKTVFAAPVPAPPAPGMTTQYDPDKYCNKRLAAALRMRYQELDSLLERYIEMLQE